MNTHANNATLWLKASLSAGAFFLLSLVTSAFATEFDHRYSQYDALLKNVVQVSEDKKQTRVDYQQLALDSTALNVALVLFSQVTKTQYDGWTQQQKLSFLINAYNGFTLQLIVANWSEFTSGKASSIRDLGSLFRSAWQKKFFNLLGNDHSLDDLEHDMIRQWFKEPRIHAALVCAAVSCPPLRNEAFIAANVNKQLDSQMQLFLADNSRNEMVLEKQQGKAYLSPIFKWYRTDFEQGYGGFSSLYDLLNQYSEAIVQGDKEQQAQRELIQRADFPIHFKDYDWRLNDLATF
jgi:hypothetical protein